MPFLTENPRMKSNKERTQKMLERSPITFGRRHPWQQAPDTYGSCYNRTAPVASDDTSDSSSESSDLSSERSPRRGDTPSFIRTNRVNGLGACFDRQKEQERPSRFIVPEEFQEMSPEHVWDADLEFTDRSIEASTPKDDPFTYGENMDTPIISRYKLTVPTPKIRSRRTPKVTGAYIQTPTLSTEFSSPFSASNIIDTVFAGEERAPLINPAKLSTTAEDLRLYEDYSPLTDSAKLTTAAEDLRLYEKRPSLIDSAKLATSARDLRRHKGCPPLINSAKLTTAAEDMRRLEIEGNYEDATIDDLEAMMEADEKRTAGIHYDLEYDDSGRPLSENEKKRREEIAAMDKVDRRLSGVSHSLKEATNGITHLAKEVEKVDQLAGISRNLKEEGINGVAQLAKEFDQFDGVSSLKEAIKSATPFAKEVETNTTSSSNVIHCNVSIHVNLSLPKLWTKNNGGGDQQGRIRNWKFTWLGAILAMFVCWLSLEATVCGAICKPASSTTNNWNFDAPEFPRAIPHLFGIKKGFREPRGGRGASDWWGDRGRVGIVYDTNDDDVI